MHAWFFNNDTSLLTDDWVDSNVLDPKFSETLQFLADLILVHKFSPNPAGWDETAQFHAGNLVMRTCGRWCFGASLAEGFETYDIQYQPYQSGPYRTDVGTDGWGVSSSAADDQAAWEVVKFLSNQDAAIDMVQLGGNVPALRSVSEMPVFAEYGPANRRSSISRWTMPRRCLRHQLQHHRAGDEPSPRDDLERREDS